MIEGDQSVVARKQAHAVFLPNVGIVNRVK